MYTNFSGMRICEKQVTKEILTHDAQAYGAIAINYAKGAYFSNPYSACFGAYEYAKIAAHCARILTKRSA